jgi:hypothetical protein
MRLYRYLSGDNHIPLWNRIHAGLLPTYIIDTPFIFLGGPLLWWQYCVLGASGELQAWMGMRFYRRWATRG